MKLILIVAAFLAVTFADNVESDKEIEDSEAAESVGLLSKSLDLNTAASAYNSYAPSNQSPPIQWKPQNTWNAPPKPIQPINTYPQNNYAPPQNSYYPQNTYAPPQNTYRPTWSTPSYQTSTTTTPVPVIKNEMYYGDNGSYKYEYQIADGTHVGEEGYFTNPNTEEASLVKKGWYSYTGADGKVYTVHYWADKTGYHAYGDHLPTPPPVPAAIQAALDQNAKEEAAQAEAEKNKPQHVYHPTQAPIYYPTQAPTYYPTQAPSYYPTQAPTYYPTQAPSYYPTQPPTYYPTQAPSHYPSQSYPQEQNYPSYGKK
ncbi:adhesive plaque matrix protein-like isoform X1 [Bombyx mandarina]|uniref:Adhesive plaque matrix protein-like isoform X1 n=1 Tax=Bombyx mandarina TaxID=7092 RepID=A0A6J2KBP6_BOMMA|nr:adhesive plaque matrix protein-like isoform X1 [Bombyx mandarina]